MNKKLIGLALFLVCSLLFVPAAMATTSCPTGPYGTSTNSGGTTGYGADYNPESQGNLNSSFSCTTGDLTYSEFQWSGSPGTISPANVTVTPVTTSGNEGFNFQISGLSVTGTNSADAVVEYEVTAAPGTVINDLTIDFNGSYSYGGTTDFTESYCTGGFNSGCQTFSVSNPSGPLNDTIDIASTTTLYITKDVDVSCAFGSAGCTANVSTFGNQYSYVPEPTGVSWVAAGLLGLLFLGRKLKGSHAA